MWTTERKPDSWRDTVIIQSYKGKKDRKDLDNVRNLHTKSEIQKVFSHIVTSEIKPIITDNLTEYQIGAIPGHKPEEHLFTLKSVLALKEKNGEAIGIEFLDLSKYFDKENLVDVLAELKKANVDDKHYNLVYELNKDTRVTVRTAVGDSESVETAETVAQGSIEAGIISSNSLSKGVDEFFASSSCDSFYGSLRLLPQSYQDDLFRFCNSPLDAQLGNLRFENLADSKLLQYNHSKSSIITVGNKKERAKLTNEFKENPPLLFGRKMKIENQGSFLGEEIGVL